MMGDGDGCGEAMAGRAGLRRRRIIDAARYLFVDNGFHATGVAQIARQSGVAVGQIYRDFAAKEDIVAAIVAGDCGAMLDRDSLQRAVVAGDSAVIWGWVRQFVRPTTCRETMTMFAEIIAEAARNARIAAIFAQSLGEARDSLLTALALLAPGERVAARRDVLADLVLAQMLGLKQQQLLRPALDVEPLVDMIVAGVVREVEQMRAAPERAAA